VSATAPPQVTAVLEGGSCYDVAYDDGDRESNVPAALVRPAVRAR
jgi:hypothetical protein